MQHPARLASGQGGRPSHRRMRAKAATPPGDAVQCLVRLHARCIVDHATRVCRIGCAHTKMRILPSRSLTLPRPIWASEGQQLHSRLWHTLRRVSQPPELAISRSNALHEPASQGCSAAGGASPAASQLGALTSASAGRAAAPAERTRHRSASEHGHDAAILGQCFTSRDAPVEASAVPTSFWKVPQLFPDFCRV